MPEFIWELPAVRPEPTETPPISEGAIDHATAAVKRLVLQFQKPKMKAMVRAFVGPLQALEQAIVDLLTKRTIDNAQGEQLNVIGRLVGQEQVNVTDTTYRSLVRARIPANKARGLGDEILKIARLVFSDYAAQPLVAAAGTMKLLASDYYEAEFSLIVLNIDLPWDLVTLFVERFLREIADTGIRGVIEFTPQLDDSVDGYLTDFAFDDSWPATVTFAGVMTIQFNTNGTTGNGRVFHIGDSNPFAVFFDESDPTNPVLHIQTGVTTVADAVSQINGSGNFSVLEQIGLDADVITLIPGATRTFAGGTESTAGTGTGDELGYPASELGVNSVMWPFDWDHLWLCDDAAAAITDEIASLDLAENNGTPLYHQAGIYSDVDYSVQCGSAATGSFYTGAGNADLQAGAADDFAFVAAIPNAGTGGTFGFLPFASLEILGAKYSVIKVFNGQATFECYDGVDTVVAGPVAVPAGAFTVGVVLERATNKMRIAVCAVGGTAVASAEADASAIGSLTHGDGASIGPGDLDEPGARISFAVATKGVGKCTGGSARLAGALQDFTDYLVTIGGLRAAME